MSKVSLHAIKPKFFLQIVILSLILITSFIVVSITKDINKSVFNTSRAYSTCLSTCTSFSEVYINSCTPISKWNSGDPACKTSSNTANIRLNFDNKGVPYYVQIKNLSPGLYCETDGNWDGIPSRSYWGPTTISNWRLTGGSGDKKVCVRFTEDVDREYNKCCGGMIKVVYNPVSTPTLKPPTSVKY